MIYVVKWQDRQQLRNWLGYKLQALAIDKTSIAYCDCEVNLDINYYFNQNMLFNEISSLIIENCDFLNKLNSIEKYQDLLLSLKSLPENNHCFLLTNSSSIKQEILNHYHIEYEVIELKKIDNKQKQTIVNDWLEANGIRLTKPVYSHLLNCLDNHYGNIINELKKIKLAILEEMNQAQQIELISNYNEENMFELLEFILFKNYDQAFKIYNYLKARQDDEILLINILNSQLFNLYMVLKLLKANVSINKIQEITSLHIYVINLYKSKFINYNIDMLLRLINSLYILEKDVKLQKVDKKIAFRNWLLTI